MLSANFGNVEITLDERAGAIFAQSPDMKGLLLVGETRDDVLAKVPGAIADMLLVGGMERKLLENLEDRQLLRMHDDIHKIMVERSIDIKARHKALADSQP